RLGEEPQDVLVELGERAVALGEVSGQREDAEPHAYSLVATARRPSRTAATTRRRAVRRHDAPSAPNRLLVVGDIVEAGDIVAHRQWIAELGAKPDHTLQAGHVQRPIRG